jgi:4'-phosphopantetheinyl transferase
MIMPVCAWLPPADIPALSKNDVHIWIAGLDYAANSMQEFRVLLSDDERRNAERFHFARDRKRFIVGRGLLRTIIGKFYLGIEPNLLEFCSGSRGKPYLASKMDGGLRFNQADSQELALYAFTRDHEIGVDIEYMRHLDDAPQVVDGSFSKAERAAFNALLDREKEDAFFNCWTRKEAFIKAIGEGLYFPLDQFDVSLAPGEPSQLLRVVGQPEEASRWSLMSFTPAVNFKAALAVRCIDCNVKFWRFPC